MQHRYTWLPHSSAATAKERTDRQVAKAISWHEDEWKDGWPGCRLAEVPQSRAREPCIAEFAATNNKLGIWHRRR